MIHQDSAQRRDRQPPGPAPAGALDAGEPGAEASTGRRTSTRVLHIVNGEFYAGAERVQELLARQLPGFGYTAVFACLKRGTFMERLERQAFEAREFVMRSRFDIAQARRIARYAEETGSAVIHTHTPRSALVGSFAAALSGLPMVHHVHSPTSRNTADALSDRINTLVERLALRRAAVLIPVSHDLAGYLREEGFRARRVSVVHNGVASSDTAVSHQPHEGLRIGVVALFRPRKGIEVLLEAVARLVDEGHAVSVRAVGEFETPEYEAEIRNLARTLDIEHLIDWRGFCFDVRRELECMDLLALPSLYGEGLPMVVLEAMAVGLPVVASSVGGVTELVRNGQDGLLVEPGDVEGLTAALGLLATQPHTLAAVGAEGRQRQQLEFSDEAMARRVGRIYDELLHAQERVADEETVEAR